MNLTNRKALDDQSYTCYTTFMKKIVKTNAMRILDKAKAEYEVHTYEHKEGEAVDGIHVAQMLKQDCKRVYKTLITQAPSKNYYVFVLPVDHELDFKKCAKAVHEKSVEMIPVKDITKVSGYVRGGCSPFGMKKTYTTVFYEACLQQATICFSGGKIGCQIEMNPQDAITLLHAQTADIVKTV